MPLTLAFGFSKQRSEVNHNFDIDAYIEKANNHLQTLTQAHQNSWGLGSSDRWDADQETGVISWTFVDGVIVQAPFQIIGTYNSLDNTFLWGWDHPSVVESQRKDAQTVLEFARKNDIVFYKTERLSAVKNPRGSSQLWQLSFVIDKVHIEVLPEPLLFL